MDLDQELAARYRTALVTGGAGFVGSHLVDRLLAAGLKVISIDDFSAGKEDNIRHNLENPDFSSVKADVSKIEEIRPHFSGVDIVFHQACSKNTICMKDPARDLEVNATGTLNMLLCAKEAGVKKFIHASTGSVYGEPVDFPSSERHQLKPVSYYGVSKLAGEQYVRLFSSLHDMDTVVLRYFHVYGPRQDNSDVGGVVSIFCRQAHIGENPTIFGDGTQVRSFTYVGDVVRINLLAAVRDEMRGDYYNCASGAKITIQELADRVLKHYARTDLTINYADWKPGDIKKFDVDNSKLKAFGFEFEKDFEEGLEETFAWTQRFLEEKLKG